MARRYGRLPSEIADLDAGSFTINAICMMTGEAFDAENIRKAATKGAFPVFVIGS